jgi:hypothetical protein
MALGTEVLGVFITDDFLTGAGRIMTIHAADQAVLCFAIPVQHGSVTLMIKKFHVIATHHLDRFDAGISIDWFCW